MPTALIVRRRDPLDRADALRPRVPQRVRRRSADGAPQPQGARHRIAELSQQSLHGRRPRRPRRCDLDHFKRVNDTLGHPCGDDVLVRVADIIRGQLRAFELAYRVGGEEFLIVLPGLGAAETTELAERIRAADRRASRSRTASG